MSDIVEHGPFRSVSWQSLNRRMALILELDKAAAVKMEADKPEHASKWHVEASVYICEPGKAPREVKVYHYTPEEAIDAFLKQVVNLRPGAWLVCNPEKGSGCQSVYWNGSSWEKISTNPEN